MVLLNRILSSSKLAINGVMNFSFRNFVADVLATSTKVVEGPFL
jgi:hypothetical protein